MDQKKESMNPGSILTENYWEVPFNPSSILATYLALDSAPSFTLPFRHWSLADLLCSARCPKGST